MQLFDASLIVEANSYYYYHHHHQQQQRRRQYIYYIVQGQLSFPSLRGR